MYRFNAFEFNSTPEERNGTNERRSEWMGKKRDNVRWTAVSVSCVFLLVHFTASFQRPLLRESRCVCTQSGSGKRSGSVSKPALFFPFLSTSPSDPRRNAERPPGTDLSNVASGRPSPFYFTAGFLVSRIFIADRAVCVSFFPRVPHPYDASSNTHISPRFPLRLRIPRALEGV